MDIQHLRRRVAISKHLNAQRNTLCLPLPIQSGRNQSRPRILTQSKTHYLRLCRHRLCETDCKICRQQTGIAKPGNLFGTSRPVAYSHPAKRHLAQQYRRRTRVCEKYRTYAVRQALYLCILAKQFDSKPIHWANGSCATITKSMPNIARMICLPPKKWTSSAIKMYAVSVRLL